MENGRVAVHRDQAPISGDADRRGLGFLSARLAEHSIAFSVVRTNDPHIESVEKMKITEALKSDAVYGIRVSCGERWMVWSDCAWEVYMRKYKARNTIILITTTNEQAAVSVLLDDKS